MQNSARDARVPRVVLRVSAAVLIALCGTPGSAQPAPGSRHTSSYIVGPSLQPLVIYGEGWSQQFTIINVDYYQGGKPTAATLKFYTREGEPWQIPVKGLGAVAEVPVTLRSGEMMMIQTEVSQQPQQLGWAHLSLPSLVDNGIYHAFTTFRKQTPDRPDLMTNVPFVDDIEREVLIPFDNTDGKYPGIALVNTWDRAATITLRVFDTNGNLRKTFTREVGPRKLDWFSLLGEHPDLAGFAGQIKAKTDTFMGAFTLQFTQNGAFTALPVVHTFAMQ